MFYSILIVMVLLSTGCSTMSPQQLSDLQAQANRPVFCIGPDDCQVKWSRALQWVKENSAYRFDQATDNLISTKGPLLHDPRPAYSITKIGQGGGRFIFDFAGGCDNMFGCQPSLIEAKASFVNFVMGPSSTGAVSTGASKPVLGVNVVEVTPPFAQTLGLGAPRGLLVSYIAPGGVAARSGIQQGDVILIYMEKPINKLADLPAAVAATPPRATVPVVIWRGGKEVTVSVSF